MDFTPLSINRGPLIPLEEGVEEYVLANEGFDSASKFIIYLAAYIEDVINDPAVIFGNLLRANYDDAICYSASPGQFRDGDGRISPGKTGEVLLVFAQRIAGSNQMTALKWIMRTEDRWRRGHPVGFESAFGSRLWVRQ